MEQGRLEITKTKKGEFVANIIFSSDKKQPISDLKLKDDSLNGKEVDVQREKGQIIKIICEGNEIYLKGKGQPNFNLKHKQKPWQADGTASESSKAPYNFIPLNEKVVPAEEIPEFDRYHQDRHTGYIELELETKTPLYIRDTLDEREYRKTVEKEKEQYINPDFFSPGGLLRIPGSSLRGMIRTMVEIMSFGKFGFFEKDRRYHFRSFADRSLDLREQYANRMLGGDENKGYFQKVKAGYLIKKGLDYFIVPAKILSNTQFFRIEERDAIKAKVIHEGMKVIDYYYCPIKEHKKKYPKQATCIECGQSLIEIYKPNPKYKVGFKNVKFKFEPPKRHNHSKPLCYAKVTAIWDRNDNNAPSDVYDGALVLSNWMRGPRGKEGKHLHWVIGPEDNSKELPIQREVIEDYENDKSRDKDTNLLRYFENNSNARVPCFYIVKGDREVISFGHTGLFRLAYLNSLKDFVPTDLLSSERTDIAEAIFGTVVTDKNNKSVIASRVFFEDAVLTKGELMQPDIPKILSNPKPTTFQHYLKQNKFTYDNRGDLKNVKGLKTYNDQTSLRGHKLYWHKSGDNWIETNKENIRSHQTQYTRITPVKKDSIFIGRIRFENLSNVELGALLLAIDLPDGLAHKLGMGKPLGLGSVRITPKLYLSDRRLRYTDLFAEWDKVDEATNGISEFKNAFKEYVLNEINENKSTLWDIERMKELQTMLDYNKKPKDEKTCYLELQEFRKRRVLPMPSQT